MARSKMHGKRFLYFVLSIVVAAITAGVTYFVSKNVPFFEKEDLWFGYLSIFGIGLIGQIRFFLSHIDSHFILKPLDFVVAIAIIAGSALLAFVGFSAVSFFHFMKNFTDFFAFLTPFVAFYFSYIAVYFKPILIPFFPLIEYVICAGAS